MCGTRVEISSASPRVEWHSLTVHSAWEGHEVECSGCRCRCACLERSERGDGRARHGLCDQATCFRGEHDVRFRAKHASLWLFVLIEKQIYLVFVSNVRKSGIRFAHTSWCRNEAKMSRIKVYKDVVRPSANVTCVCVIALGNLRQIDLPAKRPEVENTHTMVQYEHSAQFSIATRKVSWGSLELESCPGNTSSSKSMLNAPRFDSTCSHLCVSEL